MRFKILKIEETFLKREKQKIFILKIQVLVISKKKIIIYLVKYKIVTFELKTADLNFDYILKYKMNTLE